MCLTKAGALSASMAKGTEKKKREEEEKEEEVTRVQWLSVCMQVVLHPWVHKSSSIKCQPVLLCFTFGLSRPHLIDVSRQIKWKHFLLLSPPMFRLLQFMPPSTICCCISTKGQKSHTVVTSVDSEKPESYCSYSHCLTRVQCMWNKPGTARGDVFVSSK